MNTATAIPASPTPTLGAIGAIPGASSSHAPTSPIALVAARTGMQSLQLALRVSKYSHTYSVCQCIGIYPA